MATAERPVEHQSQPNDQSFSQMSQTTMPSSLGKSVGGLRKEEEKYQIPESEFIWNAPYLKQNQIFPMKATAEEYPTEQMLKMFSRKLYERSCRESEYLKPVDVEDFVKYDREELWKTSNDVMNQYIPTIERGATDSSTGLKTDISPIRMLVQKEAKEKEYYDPLRVYAQKAEDEGNHIERNPLNNHKLIQNSYFPMSRLVGSYWDKVDKESYFRNRYDKMEFNPNERDSGFSTNNIDKIDFSVTFQNGTDPHPKEDYKQSEYRNTYWTNKGFPYQQGPRPIAHTARVLNIPHYN